MVRASLGKPVAEVVGGVGRQVSLDGAVAGEGHTEFRQCLNAVDLRSCLHDPGGDEVKNT
ncbi:hypothetical protein [Corynebacterium sp. KPL3739]|uniref:hypothetical protein n=1 Tax=unclassified Corynebacterium TaxID=2624378 RepID=UPI0032EF7FD0